MEMLRPERVVLKNRQVFYCQFIIAQTTVRVSTTFITLLVTVNCLFNFLTYPIKLQFFSNLFFSLTYVQRKCGIFVFRTLIHNSSLPHSLSIHDEMVKFTS